MRDKSKIRKIADAQIRELFRQAELSSRKTAGRCVEIALKISTKTKTPIPREFKRRFCKKCHSYLVPGENCRIRVSGGKIICSCFACKTITRFGYK